MFGLPPFDHSFLPGMTDTQAHAVLQNHAECARSSCPRKLQAWALLIYSGAIEPADRIRMGF